MKPQLQLFITAAIWSSLSAVFFYFEASRRGWVLAGLGGLFLICAAIPPLARGLHHILHWTVTALVNALAMLILGIVFYFFITPAGWLVRILGVLHLSRKPDPSQPTYWIKRTPEPITPDRYRRTF